ncbi:hypothetical protein VD0002_g5544 [Verticillium dahliae]|uniref:Uncharacterized protein n=1 Tax=Verticillium dahliae TaxID=27337 RepID=A0AA44WAL7_VERDA|nr:Cutinase transcription factor 1 beta [Verticillium dahliae VDG2]PNH26987.1 hypothetical protein BJF96_g9678 [Verticillium dahliae]PNH50937.1 hypothetical protein VD0003_g6258 [Verticillium dahliae]PNH62549.1 hypothetical protein VD0002_g5544 [Verticillium dahliae]
MPAEGSNGGRLEVAALALRPKASDAVPSSLAYTFYTGPFRNFALNPPPHGDTARDIRRRRWTTKRPTSNALLPLTRAKQGVEKSRSALPSARAITDAVPKLDDATIKRTVEDDEQVVNSKQAEEREKDAGDGRDTVGDSSSDLSDQGRNLDDGWDADHDTDVDSTWSDETIVWDRPWSPSETSPPSEVNPALSRVASRRGSWP